MFSAPISYRETLAALLRSWLSGFAATLLALIAQRQPRGMLRTLMRRAVRKAVLAAEAYLFLRALDRIGWTPQRRATTRPRSMSRGFRSTPTRGAKLRRFTRGPCAALHKGDLAQRLRAVARILAEPERYIAKLVARIRDGLVSARLTASAPPAMMLASFAIQRVSASTDTS